MLHDGMVGREDDLSVGEVLVEGEGRNRTDRVANGKIGDVFANSIDNTGAIISETSREYRRWGSTPIVAGTTQVAPQRAHPENSGWLAMPGRKPDASTRQPVPWSSRTSCCPAGTATTPPRARP